MLVLDAEPNAAHRKLAQWEQEGRLKAVITQNIDGLHQKAGSKEVLELHGSIHRNYCTRCGKFFDAESMQKAEGVPHCTCGGLIKPDVVLYEEGLDMQVISKAIHYISNADVLIVGGTSLVSGSRSDRLLQWKKTGDGQQVRHTKGCGSRSSGAGKHRGDLFQDLKKERREKNGLSGGRHRQTEKTSSLWQP